MADQSTLTIAQSGSTVTYTLTLSTGYTLLHAFESIAVTFTLDGTTACSVASSGVIGIQTSWACESGGPAASETGTVSAQVSIGSSTTYSISQTAELKGTAIASKSTTASTAVTAVPSSSLLIVKTTATVQNTATSTALVSSTSTSSTATANSDNGAQSSSSPATNYALIGGLAGGIALAVILVVVYVVNKRTQRRKRREAPALEWNTSTPVAPAGMTNSAYNHAKPIGLEKLAASPAGSRGGEHSAVTTSPNVVGEGLDYSAPQYLAQVPAQYPLVAQYAAQGAVSGYGVGVGQSVQYPGYYDAAGQYHYYTQAELASQQKR